MNGRNKDPSESADGVRSFRLEHDGQELFVVSAPMAPSSVAPLTRVELEVAQALVRGRARMFGGRSRTHAQRRRVIA